MPRQVTRLQEGSVRTAQVFLAWSEPSHFLHWLSQIWNESLKSESCLSGLSCLDVARIFRDGCIGPRGCCRTGTPEGPMISKEQASSKSFLKGLHSKSAILEPKWIAFLPAILFLHGIANPIRNPFGNPHYYVHWWIWWGWGQWVVPYPPERGLICVITPPPIR